jgi:hypothetical protein
MNRPFFLFLFCVVWLACPAGCSAPPRPVSAPLPARPTSLPPGSPAGLEPAQVVEHFFGWYLAYEGNPLVDGVYRNAGYLTPQAVAAVDQFLSDADHAVYDPFLCAQDFPEWMAVDTVSVQGDEAQVDLYTSFEGHLLDVALHRDDGVWRIAAVTCRPHQPTAAGPRARPQSAVGRSPQPQTGVVAAEGETSVQATVYRSDEYGFQILLPPGWTYQELIADREQPPFGPPNVFAMVLFMPQSWADQLARPGPPEPGQPAPAPFDLEVSVGSEADFRRAYPEPERSQPMVLGGAPTVREEETLGDGLSVVRYVFQHPEHADLRVTILDPITGFPDRLAGNERVVEQFQRSLDTFRWQD